VMAGTGAEYAALDEPAVAGVTPLRPTTLYGACKTALHVASAAYLAEREVSNAWGHIFYLYGPGEHPSRLVPSVVRALKAGERFECEHPNDVRDYLHVQDVAAAFVELLGSSAQGDVNIASGLPTRVADLVAAVSDAVGRPELVDCSRSASEASYVVGDPVRLAREVGWKPRWSMADGIAATVAWWERQSTGVGSTDAREARG
jgi:nucleoside-diphosphate-sugar epimerase